MSTATVAISTRPVSVDDEFVLRQLYRSTRYDDLASVGWPHDTIEAFCDQQYDVRELGYGSTYPHAEHRVIIDDSDAVVGQVVVDHGESAVTLVDIAILPSHRGRGVGGEVLADVIAAADSSGRPVELTVDRTNRAASLYGRLGFVTFESTELHHHMRRSPSRTDRS